MSIVDLLERNHKLFGGKAALVEVDAASERQMSVNDKEQTETTYRLEITWSVLDEKANRVANVLWSRGIRKGQKIAILVTDYVEFLAIYFGVLKIGAVAVLWNYECAANEMNEYLSKADVDVLFFGPEFMEQIDQLAPQYVKKVLFLFVGKRGPFFAENYYDTTANSSSVAPKVLVDDEDEATVFLAVIRGLLQKSAGLSIVLSYRWPK